MDRKKLHEIKELLNELIEEGRVMPSDEELDSDNDYITLYEALYNLNEAMEQCGFS